MASTGTVKSKHRRTYKRAIIQHVTSRQSVTIDSQHPRIVGRGKGSDLRIDDETVSAAHCEFVGGHDEGIYLVDLRSLNGTWAAGVRVLPDHPVCLDRRTTIQIGDGVFLEFVPDLDEERLLSKRFGDLKARSVAMQEVCTQLIEAAQNNTEPVLLTGETGTGKTHFARAIHEQSARANKLFKVIDCASIPPNLIEAELFGYVKGAFTGAVEARISPFIEADGGTVFLDEVAEIPVDLQAKLLRVVANQVVKPIGASRERQVDVRIIAATLQNLPERVNEKKFRLDLHQRLAAMPIHIPPLRDRKMDIEHLAEQILTREGHPEVFDALTDEDLAFLGSQKWPGNVRQLEFVLKIAMRAARGGNVDVRSPYRRSLGAFDGMRDGSLLRTLSVRGKTDKAVILEARRALYEDLMAETGGNREAVAKMAEIAPGTLRKILRELDIADSRPGRKAR